MTTKELAHRCGCSATYILALRRLNVIDSRQVKKSGKGMIGGNHLVHVWDESCIQKVLEFRGTARKRIYHPPSEENTKRKLCKRYNRPCVLCGQEDSCHLCATRMEQVCGIISETMSLNEDMGATRTSVCRDYVR
jgi:hypothetical protein